jgi:erythromycin esterase-like protein
MDNTTVESLIEASAYPLTGTKADYDPLLKLVGNARLVLLGEASHGTHEFYRAG